MWIDFNGDGDWADQGEHVFTDRQLAAGVYDLTFTVPETINGVALDGTTTFARFRLSHISGLSFDGPAANLDAPDGEVEDYPVEIVVGDSSISGYKFNDLNANGEWDSSGINIVPQFSLVPLGPVVIGGGNATSVGPLNLGFNFEFFGSDYTQFYINESGSITFDYPQSYFSPQGFPYYTPMVAPFWSDIDTWGLDGRHGPPGHRHCPER